MEIDVNNGAFQVVMESTDFNVNVGESARIDVGQAINYIKSGEAEIGAAVQTGLTQIGAQVDLAESYANSAAQSAAEAERYRTTYIHEQGEASSQWVINHNLNKYPSVTVVDSANNEIIAEVKYTSANTCVVNMSSAFKGKAFLN